MQKLDKWPPYIAMERPLPPQKNLESQTFTESIGLDKRCDDVTTRYCNGPLKANRQYRVRVRVYTHADLFADSSGSNTVRTCEFETNLSAFAQTTHVHGGFFRSHAFTQRRVQNGRHLGLRSSSMLTPVFLAVFGFIVLSGFQIMWRDPIVLFGSPVTFSYSGPEESS